MEVNHPDGEAAAPVALASFDDPPPRPLDLRVALLAIASPAQPRSKSCQREGATLLAASGNARVVSVKEKAQNSETRRVRLYGCWTTTGRRFTLFLQRDFGLDLIERAHIEIVDGRYIGIIRDFEGGVSESQTAATWDASKHVAVRNSKPCDEVSSGDFSGVEDAVFFRNGGLAYSCNGTCGSPTTTATASSSRWARTSPSSPSRPTRAVSARACSTRGHHAEDGASL